MFDRIEEMLSVEKQSIYFHREVLYYSLEGRKMEIFTISSRDGLIDDSTTEDQPDNSNGLYPES